MKDILDLIVITIVTGVHLTYLIKTEANILEEQEQM
jgi:hypothetical protein